MNLVTGNMLDIKVGIICHQVNCRGRMGAGIAKAIRDRFPKAYEDYKLAYSSGDLRLGNAIISTPFPQNFPNLMIAHLCGQDAYWPRGQRHTIYPALRSAIQKVVMIRDDREKAGGPHLDIYFPLNIGCSLAGGDWSIVSQIINEEVPNAIIVKLR